MNSKNPIATLVTASEIEANCPVRLTDLAKRISTHLAKADQYTEKSENHRITATQYLIEAKAACDEGGFQAFCERFKIGRSRAYELVAIGTGKKTVTETRAATAERVRKHREKAATLSVTAVVMGAKINRPTIVAVTHQTAPDKTVCISAIEATPATNAIDLAGLPVAHREVERQAAAGNETLLKLALGNLISEASTVLKTLGGLQ
jgi:hypothetical protein